MPIEIITFIVLIILIRLMPSVVFEYKFKAQMEDYVIGNDLCARIFGDSIAKHWKELKCRLSFVDR